VQQTELNIGTDTTKV